MSAPSAVTGTASEMVTEADAILREVRSAAWPQTCAAIAAVGWALLSAGETREVWDRLQRGDMDPYAVLAPDMGWWDDPQECALEYAADQYLEAAKAARNRLAQAKADEETRRNRAAQAAQGEGGS